MSRMVHHIRTGDGPAVLNDAERTMSLGLNADSLAAILLMLKDHATYEEICRETIQTQHSEDERLWLLLLSPSPPISSEEILALAEKLQPAFAGDPLARPFLGMAYYRAGRYPEAIAQFSIAARQQGPWQMAAMSWPGLAMANHHLGNREESQKWLDRTAHWLALHTQGDTINHRTLGLHNLRVVEYETVQLFYQEAKALIESPPE